MGLITFLFITLIVGFIAYLIYRYAPIPEVFKTIIGFVALLLILALFLSVIGVYKLPIKW